MRFVVAALFIALAACAGEKIDTGQSPAGRFMEQIASHCGNSYQGKVVSTDAADADFAQKKLVMQVRECSEDELRIPFHVGGDHSRTWVISRTEEGLRLKHDHRHADGSEDAVTQYGGDSAMINAGRAEFPVDPFSIELFQREGLEASVTNVWAMEISDDAFAYELARENRFFRVEFDLSKPVAAPPPPWGAEG